jgi:peptidoglycan/xylan/chitin deacetylase (PgdA/CDA1 family)
MRLDDLIRGPSRPTHLELQQRRRRAAALVAVAVLALVLGAIAGAGGGDGSSAVRERAATVGWFGHLRMLAGASHHSLDFAERAQESAAIDRTLATTPFVRLAGTQHRLIALTFDDGPGPYTSTVIDTLQRLDVPATFFVVGRELTTFGAATLQRQVDLGFPVGDHTQAHANLTQLQPADQRAQIDDAAHALASGGAAYPRLFRPPYGAYDQTTHKLLRHRKMLTVLWSIDSRDYTRPGVPAIVQNVVGSAHPGSIVLMHDAGGDRNETIAALPAIVSRLRKQGYRFVTVPRLLLENPPPQQQELPPGFNPGGAG